MLAHCCCKSTDGCTIDGIPNEDDMGDRMIVSVQRLEELVPALAPAADGPPLKEWTVRVSTKQGEIGMRVGLVRGVTVVVEALTDGQVSAWNRANPELAVQQGDVLVAVNGTRGDAVRVLDAIKGATELEMVFNRLWKRPELSKPGR
mmetsp:Transcript_132256/g.382381  ORF Transcript_132256/g.382381 Transcript_132256/m.382381 type:complete len:147 (-) Transcript_132256:179-619(-)